MVNGKRILAVVPARSGSKGIPNKNLVRVHGISLIGWAGITLRQLPFLDAKVISTDSPAYADEGRRYGLDAPFLRPPAMSTEEASVLEAVRHALQESERHYTMRFDVILIVEPTSPLRQPEDLERVTRCLLDSGADSVVTVSPLPAKCHPLKVLTVRGGKADFFLEAGRHVRRRQELPEGLYWRNGVCYALTRACVLEHQAVFTGRTIPDIISRPIVNIDDPIDLVWAEFLLARQAQAAATELAHGSADLASTQGGRG